MHKLRFVRDNYLLFLLYECFIIFRRLLHVGIQFNFTIIHISTFVKTEQKNLIF